MQKMDKGAVGQRALKNTSLYQSKVLFTVLGIAIILISLILIWDTIGLKHAIDMRTQAYVADVTLQLADDIDYRLRKNTIDLQMLEEYVLELNLDNIGQISDYLREKCSLPGYTAIAVIGESGNSTEPLL